MAFDFELEARDAAARAGRFSTPHGTVLTPCFMAVGTLGTVKALDPDDLQRAGAQMILANAYHLHLRPGDEVVAKLGGLHAFMGWNGPILTDSGGFQVFSLAALRSVSEDGVEFQNHVDGSRRFFTPESVTELQIRLGADVIMQFDHVVEGGADSSTARDASERSLRWLQRCLDQFAAGDHAAQRLFPIVQGAVYPDLRREAARRIADLSDWSGYGIGGLSVGEKKESMYSILEVMHDALPGAVPRYLMGVGFPEDLVESVARGVDLFDCVAPTRMGRNGTAFTSTGRLNMRRSELRSDARPLDESCGCATCARFSRGYLRHLFASDEMLGPRLLSIHNVHFLNATMSAARQAVLDSTYASWSAEWLRRYRSSPEPEQ